MEIGSRIAKKLKLTEEFSQVSRLTAYLQGICKIFNDNHSMFPIKYARPAQQVMIGRELVRRLNYVNCLDEASVKWPFPIHISPRGNAGWMEFSLEELESLRYILYTHLYANYMYDHLGILKTNHCRNRLPIPIPRMQELDNEAIMNLVLGSYRWKRGCLYISLIQRYLLRNANFESRQEYLKVNNLI